MNHDALTPTQTRYLDLIKLGNTNQQIAALTGSTEQGVKNHNSKMLRRLRAKDRAHAVYLGLKQGIIAFEE